jgi:hypothetical protein
MTGAADEGTGLRIKKIYYISSRAQMTRGDPIICGLFVWGKGGLQQRFTLKKKSCYKMLGKVSNLTNFWDGSEQHKYAGRV